MAFFSHLRPKRIRIIPTTRRSTSRGTNWTIATPKVAIIAASVAVAANAPASELRQFIVTPTTRTIVKASTNSTAEARNAAEATAHCMQDPLFPSRNVPGIEHLKGNPLHLLPVDSLAGLYYNTRHSARDEVCGKNKKGDRWGLNPQPLEPQSRALPIELRSPHVFSTCHSIKDGPQPVKSD